MTRSRETAPAEGVDRLRLTYWLHDGEEPREVGLPFVIGVIADFSRANQESERPRVADREVVDVTECSLDGYLQTLKRVMPLEAVDVATDSAWLGLRHLVDFASRHTGIRVVALDLDKTQLQKSLKSYRGTIRDQSPIFKQFCERRFMTYGGEPIGCLVGNYVFDQSAEDMTTLEEMSRIAACGRFPFITGLSPTFFHLPAWVELVARKRSTKLFDTAEYERWRSLRARPESEFLVLTPSPAAFAIHPAVVIGMGIVQSWGLSGSWRELECTTAQVLADLECEPPTPPDITDELSRNGLAVLAPAADDRESYRLRTLTTRGETVGTILMRSRFEQGARSMIRDTAHERLSTSDVERLAGEWLMQFVDGDPANSSKATQTLLPLTAAEVSLDPGSPHTELRIDLQLHESADRPLELASVPSWVRWIPVTCLAYDIEQADAVVQRELRFVIGVLADLSGQSQSPAGQEFVDVTTSTLDDYVRRIGPRIAFTVEGSTGRETRLAVDLTFSSMADFSPRAVARRLPDMAGNLDLRDQLAELLIYLEGNAVAEQALERFLRELAGVVPVPRNPVDIANREAEVISAFGLCTTDANTRVTTALRLVTAAALHGAIGPVSPAADATKRMIAKIDASVTARLNIVMHYPDFQRLERSWLGLQRLVSTASSAVRIRARSLSKAALEAMNDAARGKSVEVHPLWSAIRAEHTTPNGEPFGCLIGDWTFDHSSEDIAHLGDLARAGEALQCPVVTGAAPTLLGMGNWQELGNPRGLPKAVTTPEYEEWRAFRADSTTRFVALAMPRFLGRLQFTPSDTTQGFPFDEARDGHESYVWLNAAYAVGMALARACTRHHWPAAICGVETGGTLSGLVPQATSESLRAASRSHPVEVSVSDRRRGELEQIGLVPLVGREHDNRATLFHVHSLHEAPTADDLAADEDARKFAQLPWLLSMCRIAHYIIAIRRDSVFDHAEAEVNCLKEWLEGYMMLDDCSSETAKSQKPLLEALIELAEPDANGRPSGSLILRVKPRFQLGELAKPLSLVIGPAGGLPS